MTLPSLQGPDDAALLAEFSTLLRSVRGEVEASLAAIFERKLAETAQHGPDVVALVEATRSLTMRGGKRFRAALVLAGAIAARGSDIDRAGAARIGVALELLQTFLLVHDDWMDEDEMRRGGPTVHVMLARHLGSAKLGAASAILAGDYAAALAQEAMAGAPVNVLSLFSRIQQDAVYGQQLDLLARTEDIERVHALKTGSYTVEGPVALGAEQANASPECRAAIHAFAAPLGIAFQLRDDILGTFGTPEETGKPAGNDLRAGKRTALVAEALPRLDEAGRAAFDAVFGKADASDPAIARASRALSECGAVQAVEARVDQLLLEARAALRSPSIHPEGARLLAGAALAMTARRA